MNNTPEAPFRDSPGARGTRLNVLRWKGGVVKLVGVLLTALTLTSVISGVRGAIRDDGSFDFQWDPSRRLLQHENPYTPYLEFLQDTTDTNPYMLHQAPNYPSSAYVFLWPWAALRWEVARFAWAFSNLAFTALLIVGLARLVPLRTPEALLLAGLLIIGVPHRATVGNGQHGLFALAFFVWAWLADKSRRPWVSGLLLALSWLKYTVTFPLSLLFLRRKRFAPVLIAGGMHAALTGFVAFWIGESPTSFFFQPVAIGSAATAAFSGQSPSVDFLGVAANLGVVLPGPVLLSLAGLGIVAVFLALVNAADDLDTLSLLALVSLALFFHRHYDRVVLVFAAAAMMVRWRPTRTVLLTLVLIVITCYVERTFNFLMDLGDAPVFSYLTASYYWATVLLFYTVFSLHVRNFTRPVGGVGPTDGAVAAPEGMVQEPRSDMRPVASSVGLLGIGGVGIGRRRKDSTA